ncbi:hypothetical protein LCGC14_1437820 [marine sediment metagenome]|uniref:Uncharacterized protein n=1 Tax=marine sediment metagenome TaxID=412755 RepID=A0A0F9MNE7_9ZZZZ
MDCPCWCHAYEYSPCRDCHQSPGCDYVLNPGKLEEERRELMIGLRKRAKDSTA